VIIKYKEWYEDEQTTKPSVLSIVQKGGWFIFGYGPIYTKIIGKIAYREALGDKLGLNIPTKKPVIYKDLPFDEADINTAIKDGDIIKLNTKINTGDKIIKQLRSKSGILLKEVIINQNIESEKING